MTWRMSEAEKCDATHRTLGCIRRDGHDDMHEYSGVVNGRFVWIVTNETDRQVSS